MSEKLTIDIDITEGIRKVEGLDDRIQEVKENLTSAVNNVEDQTKASFNAVIGMMRASYTMVSGIAQVVGGDMATIFSSICFQIFAML